MQINHVFIKKKNSRTSKSWCFCWCATAFSSWKSIHLRLPFTFRLLQKYVNFLPFLDINLQQETRWEGQKSRQLIFSVLSLSKKAVISSKRSSERVNHLPCACSPWSPFSLPETRSKIKLISILLLLPVYRIFKFHYLIISFFTSLHLLFGLYAGRLSPSWQRHHPSQLL